MAKFIELWPWGIALPKWQWIPACAKVTENILDEVWWAMFHAKLVKATGPETLPQEFENHKAHFMQF